MSLIITVFDKIPKLESENINKITRKIRPMLLSDTICRALHIKHVKQFDYFGTMHADDRIRYSTEIVKQILPQLEKKKSCRSLCASLTSLYLDDIICNPELSTLEKEKALGLRKIEKPESISLVQRVINKIKQHSR